MQPKNYGGAGHRSPYLSHAKRALYHLSYTPSENQIRYAAKLGYKKVKVMTLLYDTVL